MQIAQSNLQLDASHRADVSQTRRESLRVWRDGQGEVSLTGNSLKAQADRLLSTPQPDVTLTLSSQAQQLSSTQQAASSTDQPVADDENDTGDWRINLLKNMVEQLTGHKIRLFKPQNLQVQGEAQTAPAAQGGETPSTEAPPRVGWGLVYDQTETQQETESSEFHAQGKVRTQDGQEITVNLQVNLSRQFISENHLTLRAGDAPKDPLVVNFAGSAASLTQRDFRFDINADGQVEQMAFVNPGSAFLALDRNTNGRIDNGSELFGPTTGNGFQELAAQDADQNGWIDANDPAYGQLRLWHRDSQGTEHLTSLQQKGIGALYLGYGETPFKLADAQNQTLGQVRSSGLFLREDGTSGSLQQLDLVV
ncbi:VCBS repeat-containing protein [Gammaproteobacteria bacterium]